MKINDLAKRLNVTPRAIRLYESKGLMKPERGQENGYRYYSESEAWRLQTISSLRELGLSIEQIKALMTKLDQGDSATVHHYLELQRMALTAKWVEWKYAIGMLDELIARFEQKQQLDVEDLFQLTGELKGIQHSQSTWMDTWDFDRLAAVYDRSEAMLSTGSVLSQAEYETALDFIVQWVSPKSGEQGLDIGTGTGNLAGKLLALGAAMSALDQSKEMLAKCRERYPAMTAKLGNALALPFMDKQFTLIVSAFALHHLNGQQQLLALDQMDRVLAPGGRICIAGLMYEGEWSSSSMPPDTTKHSTNRQELLEWFRNRDFITVSQAVNPWIHVVYAVRKH
ncbi:MerR family transcriptional regulator [Paenibacillus lignilyticus]|uniref:MerR family transcriptional regulator n=1 Tax=Paenibacillus lignilyticus TaxID=1172615 RepID=A0ABS5C556_9BACL|nr:MerR family transcriptional regulator [Paenibacillus lignilyticus]MBP3961124.1 MerR family transcriptional regulator [Paenibacillus lignilyticus]